MGERHFIFASHSASGCKTSFDSGMLDGPSKKLARVYHGVSQRWPIANASFELITGPDRPDS